MPSFLCKKKSVCLLNFRIQVKENYIESLFHTISVIKGTHRSGSSLDISKRSFNKLWIELIVRNQRNLCNFRPHRKLSSTVRAHQHWVQSKRGKSLKALATPCSRTLILYVSRLISPQW